MMLLASPVIETARPMIQAMQCRECEAKIIFSRGVFLCSDKRCLSRRAKLKQDEKSGETFFAVEYVSAATGYTRKYLLQADNLVHAEIEAHSVGFTIDHGCE